ncbi:MAG: hypothetical protein Q9219_004028 [cf. Caloplaca sp. 3 TL-2023]
MDLILQGLNSNQLAAVTSPADVVQISAPPGSGKTKTLTSRVAYLIKHHQYKPWNILCLTFTIKSSREMKERLTKLIGNGMEAKLVIGTFHSVCLRYLVSYGHLIGIRKGFAIADSSDSLSIIKRIVKRMRYNIDPKVAQSRISSSKSKGFNHANLSANAAKERNVDQEEFAHVFEVYENQLEQTNLLDYDDLLLRCSDLLRQHPECVSNIEAVLIDEFQDTNIVQFDLMRLFATYQKRITTVGDPDQSIYGWRSAEIKNLGRMQAQYPETLIINLRDNYRSSGAILLAAQEIIEQDLSRPAKSLSPIHCPGTSPVLRRIPSSDAEASWIVSEIKRIVGMTGGMLRYPDFAILLRSAALSRRIESAMGKAGIPYRMVGGQRFFDRVEIKILLDYMRVVSSPTSNDAVARILNVPSRGVGNTTIKALLEEAEIRKLTLWAFIRDAVQGNIKTSTKINKPAEQGLGAFINIILTTKRKLTDSLNPLSPQSLLQHLIDKIHFQAYLRRTHEIDYEGRWANVEELITQAADYATSHDSDDTVSTERGYPSLPIVEGLAQYKGNTGEEMLSMFLANVALATELQKDEDTEDGQNPLQVTISTIHAAKGLEWPTVFIPAAYEGSIPHSRAEDTDEERRLLYVAMTRAQALLYLSCPVKNSPQDETKLSQFLLPKTVRHYLSKAGPTLNSGMVSDVARILKRKCPSEHEIYKTSQTLQSREDDLWPPDGQQPPEITSSVLDSQQKVPWSSKLQTSLNMIETPSNHEFPAVGSLTSSTIVMGNNITMENSSSFSMNSFGGFTSATNQLHRQTKESQVSRQSRRPAAGPYGAVAETLPMATGRKRKLQSEAQSSLISLWGNPMQPTKMTKHVEASGTEPQASFDSKDCQIESRSTSSNRHGNDTSISAHGRPPSPKEQTFLRRKPLAVMPDNAAQRDCWPAIKISRSRSQDGKDNSHENDYVFLSSSPPSTTNMDGDLSGTAELIPENVKETADAVHSLTDNPPLRGGQTPKRTVCAASTAQCQGGNMPRKTLGVRRSMCGWKATGSQGFAVPARVQKQ